MTSDFKTLTGQSIAGNPNALWEINVTGVQVNSLPTVSHFWLDFGDNGILLNATSNSGSNLNLEPNPVPGGQAVTGQGEPFNAPNRMTIGGNGVGNTFASFLAADWGVGPSGVNEFFMAEELTPTAAAPVPEPASLALLTMGLAGLGMVIRRRT